MKVRELNELYYLNKIIKRYEARLQVLYSKLEPGGMNINGMPRCPSPQNIMEQIILEIDDIKNNLSIEKSRYSIVRKRIENKISMCANPRTRLILSYRFIDLLSWRNIAQKLGGHNTEESVKMCCYRFINDNY